MSPSIIMMLCVYPILLLCVGMMISYAKPREGLFFGARLSAQRAHEPRGQEIARTYRRQMWLITAILTAVSIPFNFVPYESVMVFLWVIWICVMVFVIALPFVRANRAVRDWKREQGWCSSQVRMLVELSDAGAVRCVKWQSYILPTAVSLAAVAVSAALTARADWPVLVVPQLIIALMSPLLALFAVLMDRQRLAVISSDSAVNRNYNRARRRNWSICWQFAVWLNTAYVVSMTICTLFGEDAAMNALLWGSIGYLALLLIGVVWLMKKGSDLNKAYLPKMELIDAIDDDDKWLGGILYYDPADIRVNVEKRVGIGMTINMATLAGKIFTVVLAVVMVGCLVLCGGLVWEEFAGLRWQETGGDLVASQIFEAYRIPEDEVQDVALVHELPDLSRRNGTQMEHLSKGTFRDRVTGEKCELFLDPQNDLFVTFRLDGTTYYISGDDDAETQWLYECLAGE